MGKFKKERNRMNNTMIGLEASKVTELECPCFSGFHDCRGWAEEKNALIDLQIEILELRRKNEIEILKLKGTNNEQESSNKENVKF